MWGNMPHSLFQFTTEKEKDGIWKIEIQEKKSNREIGMKGGGGGKEEESLKEGRRLRLADVTDIFIRQRGGGA